MIAHNPAVDMRLPKEEKRLPRHALSQSEVEAVLAQADPSTIIGLRTRAIMELLYSTALHRAEARPKLTDDPAQRLLFVTARGNRLHNNDLSARVRRYMDRAGVGKEGACHLFRHTAATLMHSAGADIRHLQGERRDGKNGQRARREAANRAVTLSAYGIYRRSAGGARDVSGKLRWGQISFFFLWACRVRQRTVDYRHGRPLAH